VRNEKHGGRRKEKYEEVEEDDLDRKVGSREGFNERGKKKGAEITKAAGRKSKMEEKIRM